MRPGPQKQSSRLVSLLTTLACLAAASALCAGGAAAAPRVRDDAGATAGGVAAETARVARYWTPARMRDAAPLDGSAAKPAASATASFVGVPDTTVPPYAVNGRLFIRQGKNSGYCSGTAIDSASRELVLTAGHCVNSGPEGRRGGSTWSSYLEFVPGYSDGLAPFGAFIARRNAIYAPKPWLKRANPNFDVGAFLTMPNANGENVADAVGGGATIVTDQDRHQQFQTFGYPGASTRMRTCDSPYTGDDSVTYAFAGPPTMAIRCHWAPGASGGGWLISEGTAIDGLTSYGLQGDKVHTYSPYFGSGNVGALVAGL
jgi:V8-like Glu-specific endopeptidase